MTQEELDRQLSEISDEVLIEKSRAILSDWCAGGKKFTMSVPPTRNCPDLIVAELIERFKRYSDQNDQNGQNKPHTDNTLDYFLPI